jgi:hypothetical protein
MAGSPDEFTTIKDAPVAEVWLHPLSLLVHILAVGSFFAGQVGGQKRQLPVHVGVTFSTFDHFL